MIGPIHAPPGVLTDVIPLHDENPTIITPFVTWVLIAINCAAFLWQMTLPPEAIQASYYQLGAIPAVLLGTETLSAELKTVPAWATLFTSMFMHGGFLHLGGNMLYLWIFGNNVEDAMGHVRFVIFYLLCGFAATAAQIALDPGSSIPMVGASGAISGVLGAYLLLYPTARVRILIPIFIVMKTFFMRAVWVLAIYFGLQILGTFGSTLKESAEGGTAYGAHLGGFLAGVLLIGWFRSPEFKLHNPLKALIGSPTADQPHRQTTQPVDGGQSRIPDSTEPDVVERRDPAGAQPGRMRNTDAADLLDPDDLDDLARDRDRLKDL